MINKCGQFCIKIFLHYRYRDFRVGIFYFASPCILHHECANTTRLEAVVLACVTSCHNCHAQLYQFELIRVF